MHDHDDIDFTFVDIFIRPGPAMATVAPEMDPVERRLEREQVKAAFLRPIEVKHNSGKVKA
jgi:hypothetical protein